MQKRIYILLSKVRSWTTKYVTPNMSIVNFVDPQFYQYAISLPFCQTRVARSSLNDLIRALMRDTSVPYKIRDIKQ